MALFIQQVETRVAPPPQAPASDTRPRKPRRDEPAAQLQKALDQTEERALRRRAT